MKKEENKQGEEQKLTTEEVKLAISEVISEVRKKQKEVTEAGGELKRSHFVNLDEKGFLTPDNIVREWDAIQEKKSSLCSNQRGCVQMIVYDALRRAAVKRAKQIEAQSRGQKEEMNQMNQV